MTLGVLGPLLPESITRPSQRRLLSILLLHRDFNIDRDRLIDCMWGHRPPRSARNALHVHISALRKAISGDVIATTTDGYRIDLNGHGLDVSDFDRLASAAHEELDFVERVALTQRALELWRGDPYPELEEDTFALPEVTRLNESRVELLELHMSTLLALGHNDTAIPQLRELVERYPLRERLHEDLMLALYRCGRQADALRQFRSAQRILGEELGIEPGTALRELEERILLQDRDLDTLDVRPTPRTLPTFTASFVGREDTLGRARSLIDDRGVVVVAGAAGIGKTALADVLADECRARGGRVLELRGTHGLQHVPFGALAAFVPLNVGVTDTETVTRAIASIVNTGESGMTVVDDAHLLDRESAALISGIAQSRGARLVITVTSGEHLPADITAIWARWPDCRIDLAPLTRDEVREMVAGLVAGTLDDGAVDEILSITLGYPLYVAAVAAEVSDRVENADEDGITAVKSLSRSSDRLIRLLDRRLSRLDREERRLFDAIALAESVPIGLVRAIDDIGALPRLETSGLVRVGTEYAQVTHPLLATVANETLTPEGRRACARRLLAGIEENADPGDVTSMVRMALGVGVVPSTEQLEVAAGVAMAWRDFTGAARIAAHAPDDPQLIVLRARALRFLGEVPDEVPVDLDENALVEFVSAKSQAMAYGERRFGDAIAMLQEAMASLTDSTHRNRLATELLILSGLSGDMDALLGASRSVDDQADPATRLLAVAVTQLAEGLTLSTSSADETYAKGRQIADSVDSDSLLVEQLEMSRALTYLADGRFLDARVRLGQTDGKAALGAWLMIESVMADAWSSAGEALRLAESAVSALEDFDPIGNLAQAKLIANLRRAQ
ncbi:MAG: BTAD domain-containing putative transcriptional regulator, partial [Acidimicrobiia bacterium]